MATYVIGDIQGCYDPLMRLLDKINFDTSKDILWFTGDLVNRGPKSIETLRFIKNLGKSAISVLGNHDLYLLALANGLKVKDSKSHFLKNILNAPDRHELLNWLRMKPLAHFDKNINTILVHAGIPGQWTIQKTLQYASEVENILQGQSYAELLIEMYGNLPNRWSSTLQGIERYRFIINALTRMRMVHKDGRLNFSYKEYPNSKNQLVPWYKKPNSSWSETRIIFGHWSALGLFMESNFICLDDGCVWGRNLVAAKLLKKVEIIKVGC